MSGDAEQDYFADGISEDIITALSKLAQLFVIARNSSFTFKGKTVHIGEVGKSLGVRYVLEGSVRKAGARVRITAQLIDATTGGHLWAERFDRELTDVFAVQDDVTTRIVAALELNLSPRDRKNIEAEHTDSPEAYDYFLRGRALWWRHAKATNFEAEALLRRAIELDPGFGPAYAFLAAAKVTNYVSNWSASPAQALEEAEKAARLAVKLDEAYPFALFALAGACIWSRRHDEAANAGEKVVALNPSFAEGYGMLALIYNHVGRSEEAVACVDRAMALDPLANDMLLHFQGQGLYQIGRYEDAIRVLKRRIERNPETDASRALLAAAYGQLGRVQEAREAWRGLMRRQSGLFRRAAPKGAALQERGRLRAFRRGPAEGWVGLGTRSAPQHHAGAAGRLEGGADLLRFGAVLRRQAHPIERAEAAASHHRAEHERVFSADDRIEIVLDTDEGAHRRPAREARRDLHAPGRKPARDNG